MQPSKYPKHRFSASARKRLKSLPPVVLHTTLITPRGPAVGTIWHAPTLNDTFTVVEVKDGRVQYDDDGWDTLPGFLSEVQAGGYILVGVSHPVETYIPHIIT